MVLVQVPGVELGLLRVLAVVPMQAAEVEAEAVVLANPVELGLVVDPAAAQALVNIVTHMVVVAEDILALVVPVVVVVEAKQREVIMDLVVMDLVMVVDLALVMQLVTTTMHKVLQMQILMVVAVAVDMAQMVVAVVAAALGPGLAMPSLNYLRLVNLNMEPNLSCVMSVSYNIYFLLFVHFSMLLVHYK